MPETPVDDRTVPVAPTPPLLRDPPPPPGYADPLAGSGGLEDLLADVDDSSTAPSSSPDGS